MAGRAGRAGSPKRHHLRHAKRESLVKEAVEVYKHGLSALLVNQDVLAVPVVLLCCCVVVLWCCCVVVLWCCCVVVVLGCGVVVLWWCDGME